MSNPKDNVTPIREDGPALQKLFAMIEPAPSYRSEVPVEMDLAARVQGMDENPEALASNGDPVIEGSADPAHFSFDALVEHGLSSGANIVNGMPWSFKYMGLPVTHENDDHYLVCMPDGSTLNVRRGAQQSGAAAMPSTESPSPMQYGKKLHEAGEAAISILKEMCAAEFAMGNPRNMPEPVLGWYGMTLAYQLCVLEACNHNTEARLMEAKQLRAAVNAIKRCEPRYAEAVMTEIEDTLNGDRVQIMATLLPGADLSYGGELTW